VSEALELDQHAALDVLRELSAIPTAPLHEQRVARYVWTFLRDIGLAPRADPYGNLIATYHNGDSPRPVAFVAHLDHPGLEVSTVAPDRTARASLLGAVPAACFERPVPVRILGDNAEAFGTIVGYELDASTGRVETLRLLVDETVKAGDFAIFDLPSFQPDGDQIALRAADDLAGVAAALVALKAIAHERLPGIVSVVFTRAEEIGLIGAALVAEQRLLPPATIVVSLECSRELPGAAAGSGPVIRVGDRTRSFHPDGEALLLAARDRLPNAPIQRQLMSGGTCEAVAFGLAGYRTTGVALPLINYHNVGPDNVIPPERIDARDSLGEVQLLVTAVAVAPEPPNTTAATRLAVQVGRYRDRLQATATDQLAG